MSGDDSHGDDLRKLWQTTGEQPQREDHSMNLRLAREKQRSLFDVLREQDMTAYIISLSFAPLTAWCAWSGRRSLWLLAGYLLMTVTLAAGAAAVWRNARRARRAERIDLSRREHQQQLIRFHDARIRFSKSVKYWYAIPLFAGGGLVLYPITAHFLGRMGGLLLVAGFLLICWISVWHMHDVRGVADLRRRRDDLQQLLDEMNRTED